MAIAENAHRIAQYALSKVPSNILYWLTSKVLNLPPETAMQTTQFLKSRSDFEILAGDIPPNCQDEQGSRMAIGIPSEIERRLEKLELEYQVLQETHNKSLQLLTYEANDLDVTREKPLSDGPEPQQIEASAEAEPMQSMQLEPFRHDTEANIALQGVGLRLGRIFLEWAADTMKQSLIAAASKSSGNPALVGAGVDLANRLVDAVVT